MTVYLFQLILVQNKRRFHHEYKNNDYFNLTIIIAFTNLRLINSLKTIMKSSFTEIDISCFSNQLFMIPADAYYQPKSYPNPAKTKISKMNVYSPESTTSTYSDSLVKEEQTSNLLSKNQILFSSFLSSNWKTKAMQLQKSIIDKFLQQSMSFCNINKTN